VAIAGIFGPCGGTIGQKGVGRKKRRVFVGKQMEESGGVIQRCYGGPMS